jgi:mannose-6-phosphate isomerase-like protein (cupin superfamily)
MSSPAPWPKPEKFEVLVLDFGRIGGRETGYISVADGIKSLPFQIARVFWTYFTPEEIIRGRHAHYRTEQVLIAVAGEISVTLEFPDGSIQAVRLSKPNTGVYIPPYVWHTMQYSHNAVQLAMASTPYEASDYIRDKAQWRQTYGVASPDFEEAMLL